MVKFSCLDVNVLKTGGVEMQFRFQMHLSIAYRLGSAGSLQNPTSHLEKIFLKYKNKLMCKIYLKIVEEWLR